MDNRTLDVVSEGQDHLRLAITLAWPNAPGSKATHYKIVKLKSETKYYGNPTTSHHQRLAEDPAGIDTLILLWGGERAATPLPYPVGLDGAYEFVRGWLEQLDYGQQPDHDGSNGRGWRVFTEAWGHVANHHYTIVGVQPAWAMYGK